jgi:hypothetical protein
MMQRAIIDEYNMLGLDKHFHEVKKYNKKLIKRKEKQLKRSINK